VSPSPDSASEAADRLAALLERVVEALDLEAEVVVEEDEETVRGTIDGDDLGVLIGRHGQTIDALEHLASRVAFRDASERKRVVVDAAGYRARRAEALERQAERAAGEAVRFGRPVALDAMVAAERRVVHEFLRDRHDVETYSEGDEPDRHLVIAPVVS
jgi:spoIIIJ-associated protein